MANLAEVLRELEHERGRIDEAIRAIGKLVGRNQTAKIVSIAGRPKRTMSVAARRRIAAAQRARWAKWKAKHAKKAA